MPDPLIILATELERQYLECSRVVERRIWDAARNNDQPALRRLAEHDTPLRVD